MWPFKKSKEQLDLEKEQQIIKDAKIKEDKLNHKFIAQDFFKMKDMFIVFNKNTWTIECYEKAYMWEGIQKAVEALNTLQPLNPDHKLEILKVSKMSFTSV